MDPIAPACTTPVPALSLSLAPAASAQVSQTLPGPLGPSVFLASGQVHESARGLCPWRPWLASTSEPAKQVRTPLQQAADGAPAAEVTKAESGFHHPVRLYWPKSRSVDYLYSVGEILLNNFPIQATINLYEDSDSQEEEEEEEVEEDDKEEETEKAYEKGQEGCGKVAGSSPPRATAHLASPAADLSKVTHLASESLIRSWDAWPGSLGPKE
ncbi:protein ripply1 [Ochotona princeps]|uniref:protein ripply1 n=1 Tax=Ochotona princeps TaxID=9978 RepID=UPI002714C431|nr:protein ripply1 [Ochotona princeps]